MNYTFLILEFVLSIFLFITFYRITNAIDKNIVFVLLFSIIRTAFMYYIYISSLDPIFMLLTSLTLSFSMNKVVDKNISNLNLAIQSILMEIVLHASRVLFTLICSILFYKQIDLAFILVRQNNLIIYGSMILNIILLVIIQSKYEHKNYSLEINSILALSVSILLVLYLIEVITYYGNYISIRDFRISMILILIFIINCISLFLIHKNENQSILIKTEQENIKDQLNIANKYLKSQEELRKLKHDTAHILSTINNYNQIQIDELYKTYNQKFSTIDLPVKTGIDYIDTIINVKRSEAKEKNIQFNTQIQIGKSIPLKEDDFTLLLMNLLDNAIEHIGINKQILLKIIDSNDIFSITVINSVNSPVLDEQGKFLHKENNINHGFGLFSIRSIVEKYNGFINYQENKDINEITCGIIIQH